MAVASGSHWASLRYRTWFRLPNLSRILGDGAVARKLAAAGDIQDCFLRPFGWMRIQRPEPVLRFAIRCQIGQVQVEVATCQKHIAQRVENPRFAPIEVPGKDKVECCLGFRLILVVRSEEHTSELQSL